MPESPEPFSRVANVYRSLENPNSGHVAQGAHSNDTRAEPGWGGGGAQWNPQECSNNTKDSIKPRDQT